MKKFTLSALNNKDLLLSKLSEEVKKLNLVDARFDTLTQRFDELGDVYDKHAFIEDMSMRVAERLSKTEKLETLRVFKNEYYFNRDLKDYVDNEIFKVCSTDHHEFVRYETISVSEFADYLYEADSN